MKTLVLENGLDLTTTWWTEPEYADNELYLPGQSRLSAEDMSILESVSNAADKNKLIIPAMPQAAMEASRMLKDPNSEIADIAVVIAKDPGMTANILRFANSAMYGCRFPIDTVERAVAHLGMRHLQTVVLQIAMNRMSSSIQAKAYAEKEWKHSLACALISRKLAQRCGLDEDLCYLAGLLHDIGRLPVITALHKKGLAQGDPMEDSPTEIIVECLHRAVGMQVADYWELPPIIQDAIGNHLTGRMEGEESPAAFPSTKVAEAAGNLCLAIGEGCFRKPYAVLDCPSLRDIGLSRPAIQKFLKEDLPEVIQDLRTGY